MICGVNIGGKDTLEEWGLMLCNDLSIGAAVPRYRFINIPEMSGALDLTEALTGTVPYDQRQITFTLFAVHDVIAGTRTPATEEHFQTVLARFSGFANGKRLHVYLPDNPDHYFVGRVSVGGKSGYNSGRVKVEVLADPYRIKDGETTLTVDDDDFFKTATPGALVTFDDGGDDLPMKSCVVSLVPEQDLNGYDSPWPGGGGKNKLDILSATPVKVENGITFTVNNDGTVTANGTATLQCQIYWRIPADIAKTFGGMVLDVLDGQINSGIAGILEDAGTPYTNYAYTSRNPVISDEIANIPVTNANFIIRIQQGTTVNNFLLKPMIRPADSASGFAPYSNICPISGHSGAELIRTGKNLCQAGYQYNVNNIIIPPVWLPSGVYTVSFGGRASVTAFYIRKGDTVALAGNAYATKYNSNFCTFTADEDGYYYVQLYRSASSDSWDDAPITSPQLELGSSPTAYEAHQIDTYSVTFSDQGTVYGGTFDFVSGTLTVTHRTLTIDGTSPIAWVSSNGCAQVQSTGLAPTNDITQFYSDRFKAHPNSGLVNMNNEFAVNGTTTLYIKAPALFTSLEEAKTYFTNNPTQFVGLRPVPLEYTLSAQQIETLLGENNVWSNDGDISELVYMFTDEIIINNEGMPAIPTINASEAGPTVTLRGASHVLAAGDNRFSDFILQSGENVMQVEDPAGTLTIKYQEGML